MRTSRISKETARVTEALRRSNNNGGSDGATAVATTRSSRRTRASIPGNGDVLEKEEGVSARLKKAGTRGKSAATSPMDIEDLAASTTSTTGETERRESQQRSASRKRKRNQPAAIPPELVQALRTSPRKAAVKIEEKKEEEEEKDDDDDDGDYDNGTTQTSARRPKRQPAKQTTDSAGEVVVHPPPNWRQMYELTAAMRKLNPAPVDTMGCETLAEEGLSERDRRFQTLIALMLSSQTKDTVTAVAMRRLQTELPRPGLTLERVLEVEPDYLNELIWAVGFHNNKTKFIKRTAEILRDEFAGDIPDTIEGMTSLPGVGPKMAYLCMSAAWGRDEGIGVDVHVHRITNLWGWHKTKNPEETRAMLESWLPKDKWHDINHLLVGFGQTICAPVGRKCGNCTLSEKGLCPSAVVDRKVSVKRVKEKKGQGRTESEVLVKEEDLTVDGSRVRAAAAVKEEDIGT